MAVRLLFFCLTSGWVPFIINEKEFRGMLCVKCYCEEENCKINIAEADFQTVV